MDFECKGCVGNVESPSKDGTCTLQLNANFGTKLPQGCPYFMGRMKWRKV